MNEETKIGGRKKSSRQSATYDDGGDSGESFIGGDTGCLMQLFKMVWWVIKLPFRIVGFFLNLFGDDD